MRGFQKVAVECPKSPGFDDLLVDECDGVTPGREHAREVLRRRRRRVEDVRRDEVDYLPENGVYCLRCFWWCLFLHNPVGYRITPPVATLNIHPLANANAVSEWDANERRRNGTRQIRAIC